MTAGSRPKGHGKIDCAPTTGREDLQSVSMVIEHSGGARRSGLPDATCRRLDEAGLHPNERINSALRHLERLPGTSRRSGSACSC